MKTLRLSDKEKIAKLLEAKKLVILPTDTVYGLACLASDVEASEKLYATKNRENKPGTIIGASIEDLAGLGIKRAYLKAVEQFWPGAISVVIPCGPELAYLHRGVSSLAVRVPKQSELLDLLELTGPLLTSSANMPGEKTATSIQQAQEIFGNKVEVYVYGGVLADSNPSTVIRIVDDAIEILRQGAVILDEAGRIIEEK